MRKDIQNEQVLNTLPIAPSLMKNLFEQRKLGQYRAWVRADNFAAVWQADIPELLELTPQSRVIGAGSGSVKQSGASCPACLWSGD